MRFPRHLAIPRSAALPAAVAAALAAAAPAPAGAETLVPADPWQVVHIAREFGATEVGRDAMQDPRLTVRAEGEGPGSAFTVTFYGCTMGRDCRTLLFALRLEVPDKAGAALAKRLAAWNAEKLFGRAWADERGRAVLDHAVAMDAGLPPETLRATFAAWSLAVEEFLEHLDISGG